MEFKKIKIPIQSSDLYYDLFDGGYINPSKLLADSKDLTNVEKAIKTVKKFLDEAESKGLIEQI